MELSSYKLIDVQNGNVIKDCYDVPKVADAAQAYVYVDYVYNDGNIAPTALISSATPSAGEAPWQFHLTEANPMTRTGRSALITGLLATEEALQVRLHHIPTTRREIIRPH